MCSLGNREVLRVRVQRLHRLFSRQGSCPGKHGQNRNGDLLIRQLGLIPRGVHGALGCRFGCAHHHLEDVLLQRRGRRRPEHPLDHRLARGKVDDRNRPPPWLPRLDAGCWELNEPVHDHQRADALGIHQRIFSNDRCTHAVSSEDGLIDFGLHSNSLDRAREHLHREVLWHAALPVPREVEGDDAIGLRQRWHLFFPGGLVARPAVHQDERLTSTPVR